MADLSELMEQSTVLTIACVSSSTYSGDPLAYLSKSPNTLACLATRDLIMMLRAMLTSASGNVVKTVPLYEICLNDKEVGHPTLVRTKDRPKGL
jgi:hypothetical protein